MVREEYLCFYSSPSCDGDQRIVLLHYPIRVSILPRLATGIITNMLDTAEQEFLFFPVLRRGSNVNPNLTTYNSFYSSPSCDGDLGSVPDTLIQYGFYSSPSCDGDRARSHGSERIQSFYSSPSCDGDR